jgi:hypothetical protein
MSKLLNLGKLDEKRNSDHSDNEADADFQRAMCYQKKAEVDVSLFGRKLHRRRKLKNSTNLETGGGGSGGLFSSLSLGCSDFRSFCS